MGKGIGFFERFKIDTLAGEGSAFVSGVVEVDSEACKGCGLCEKACPACTLEICDGKAKMIKVLPMCMSCGDCVAICPEGAIKQKGYIGFSFAFRYLDRGAPSLPRKFT